MTSETCQSPDSISPKPGSNGDQAVNVAELSGWLHEEAHRAATFATRYQAASRFRAHWMDRSRKLSEAASALTASASEPEPVTSWQAEARHHAIELEQCSIFAVDAGPAIAKSMTDAAAWLRNLAAKPVPTPDGAVEARQTLRTILREFHRDSCYPEAMYFEIDDAIDKITALSHPSNGGLVEEAHVETIAALLLGSVNAPEQAIYRVARQIVSALSHPADGWLDISTAPRDGTWIVAWGKPTPSAEEGPYVTRWQDYGEGSMAHADWEQGKGPKGTFWHTEPMHGWTNGWSPKAWSPLPAPLDAKAERE